MLILIDIHCAWSPSIVPFYSINHIIVFIPFWYIYNMLLVYYTAGSFGSDSLYLVLWYYCWPHPRGWGTPQGVISRWVQVGHGWPGGSIGGWRACTCGLSDIFFGVEWPLLWALGHFFRYVPIIFSTLKSRWDLCPFTFALRNWYLTICFHIHDILLMLSLTCFRN